MSRVWARSRRVPVNWEHLEAFRVELLAERERVDRLLESLAAFLEARQARGAEWPAGSTVKTGRLGQRDRSPEPGTRKSGTRASKYEAAIERCGETFDAHEVVHKGGLAVDARSAQSALSYLAKTGRLAIERPGRSGYPAIFRRGPKWNGAAGPVARSAPAPSPRPSPPEPGTKGAPPIGAVPSITVPGGMPEGRSPTERMTNALLEVVSATPLSADQVIALVLTRWPGLWTTPEQKSNLRIRLMDLAGAMRITREGRGPEARYSRRGTPPAAREDARPTGELKIHVPRDADAGVNDNDE